MNIRPITPDYAVSPAISAQDIPAIVAAGYKSIICNRPDDESLPEDQMQEIATAAQAAGIEFARNPFNHMQFGPDVIAQQATLLDSLPGPVFAYCASGTRCATVWAFSQAGHRDTNDILAATRAQGYMLDHLAPALDRFAQDR